MFFFFSCSSSIGMCVCMHACNFDTLPPIPWQIVASGRKPFPGFLSLSQIVVNVEKKTEQQWLDINVQKAVTQLTSCIRSCQSSHTPHTHCSFLLLNSIFGFSWSRGKGQDAALHLHHLFPCNNGYGNKRLPQ